MPIHPSQRAFCIDITNTDSGDLQNLMDTLHDSYEASASALAEELQISQRCANFVLYLRGRSRWTQEKEDELIRLDKAGEPLPNVLSGEF